MVAAIFHIPSGTIIIVTKTGVTKVVKSNNNNNKHQSQWLSIMVAMMMKAIIRARAHTHTPHTSQLDDASY